MKRLIALALAVVMAVSMVACGGDGNASGTSSAGKVAIITGTVSQGEEEFQAAENMKKKYPDRVVTATYPDNFDKEQETTISTVGNLLSDPDVKALVFLQAVTGATAAIEKAKEINPDLVVIAGVAAEDPGVIGKAADVVLGTDSISMGRTIPQQAAALGAKTLVHYSFPRHMSSATTSARFAIMKEECEKLGIEFVEATAPDPLSDVGLAGAQQFMMEDVPKMIEKYGEDTAIYSTNCGLQEPIIKQVIAGHAIYPQQCCPSPYHAYPGALGIEIPEDKAGDLEYLITAISESLAEKDMTGRMSTWKGPVNMSVVEGATEYLIDWIDAGCDLNNKIDNEKLQACIEEAAGSSFTWSQLELDGVVYENNWQILGEYVTF